MIITESAVQLQAQHQKTTSYQQSESLTVWNRPTEETASENLAPIDKVYLSDTAQALQHRNVESVEQVDEEDEPKELDLIILKRLTEMLTGKKIKLSHTNQLAHKLEQASDQHEPQKVGQQTPSAGSGFGLAYDYHESHHEQESLQFSAAAQVATGDGHTIDIQLKLNMSREFYEETNFSLRVGEALKDPLVLNFSGQAAQLTESTFAFDLDFDGEAEQMAFVAPGSGFLALDRNGDGVVNDGSELFGPATNDGFAELARYDEDGNQWIDEQDSIYDRLSVWSRTSDGTDELLSLRQRNVGAIYLGSVSTPFTLTDADNNQQGQMRETGLFLQENGGAGTIQELDLVV
ncbi:MAG: hypothetical protein JXR59_04815 [Desulfuromonadaceae bacterium]|nr:hypothetical protein [Desulfuromonadaceae bacterium]